MEYEDKERRKSPRYPIEARVILYRQQGEPISANAVDMSSSGMLVRVDRSMPFSVGDEVTVEVDLPPGFDEPLSRWGIGTVVRLDGEHSAIHLRAGSFSTTGLN